MLGSDYRRAYITSNELTGLREQGQVLFAKLQAFRKTLAGGK